MNNVKILYISSLLFFSLTLVACDNTKEVVPEYNFTPCPAQPNAANNPKQVYFEIQGLDNYANSKLELNLTVDQPNNQLVRYPLNFSSNGCTQAKWYGSNIEIKAQNGFYRLNLLNNGLTNKNQQCQVIEHLSTNKINNDYHTDAKNPVIKISCKTPVNLKPLLKEQYHVVSLGDKNIRVFPIQFFNGNKFIDSKSFEYAISDTSIADIDETGKIIFKKYGIVAVKIHANRNFYQSANEIVYIFDAKDTGIIYQNIDIGQSSVLPVNSKYQVIVPENKTLIRALVRGKNSDTPISQAYLTIKSPNGNSNQIKLTCPTTANTDEFEENHYKLGDTCYAILDKSNWQNMVQNSIFEFNINGFKKLAMPYIKPKTKMELKIFIGENAKGKAQAPDIKKVEAYLRQVYPFSKVNIEIQATPISLTPDNLNTALGELDKIHKNEDPNMRKHYYGLVPQACYGTVGLGWVGGPTAVGIAPKCGEHAIQSTMMHELGHNLGLNHAPCGGATGMDNFWYNNLWLNADKAHLSASPLFLQAEEKIISPFISQNGKYQTDIMGYCGGLKLNKHSYKQVANFMQDRPGRYALAQETASEDNLLKVAAQIIDTAEPQNYNSASALKIGTINYKRSISGEIVDDKIILNPIDLLPPQAQEDNEFNIYLGHKLIIRTATKEFGMPIIIRRIDHSPRMFFEVLVDFDDEIQELEFWQNDTKLDYEFKNSDELNSEDKQISFFRKAVTSSSKELVSYKDGKIFWQNHRYKYMKAVFIDNNGARNLLTLNATGGEYTLPFVKNGKLEVVLADGLNNVVKIFNLSTLE